MWELPENSNFTLSAPPRSYRIRESRGDRILQDGKSYPAVLLTASIVTRLCEAATQEPRCEFLPISDESCADTDASTPDLATSDARLTQSSNGSDVCNHGHRGKCVFGWSDEQRASADFSDAALASSVGSTTGSARTSPVPFCSLGYLTNASAATCGPVHAFPHNDWIDGRHACRVRSYVPPLQNVCSAKSVSPRAPGAPARRSGSVEEIP